VHGSLEEVIGTRWTVGLEAWRSRLVPSCLVRYSIERGFFGPGVRVVLGFMLAAALVGAGEYLRRRDNQPIDAVKGAYIPGMLTATGTIAAFGTIYAAYALYHFIGPQRLLRARGDRPRMHGCGGVARPTLAGSVLPALS